MSLKDQITEDMKNAMRAKETTRLGAIRLLLAAIKQREVDDRIVLDDAAIIATVEKMIKQRKDSISQFEKANRDDLVAIEVAVEAKTCLNHRWLSRWSVTSNFRVQTPPAELGPNSMAGDETIRSLRKK